jgi:competence protein ComEC
VLLPLLRARGHARIDTLMLSHRDTDHIGGARAVLNGVQVIQSRGSIEDGHALRAELPSFIPCEDGQHWTWDGVHFDILAPRAADRTRQLKSNAMSCVLSVSSGGEPRAMLPGANGNAKAKRVLLTGDIEREQELALVARHGEQLRSDVLLVPHHGSRTSSTPEFVEAVQPTFAVAQSGYRNRFGHPAAEVRARYMERGIEWIESPTCGAWSWSSLHSAEGGNVPVAQTRNAPRCERDLTRRYWRHGGMVPEARPR